jgi:methylglutaconyl-CoA hydratase
MDYILTVISDPVAYVTLNRPEVHNAFNEQLIAELTETFLRLGANPTVAVIVLEGAGKSFCAGADLEWMAKMAGYSFEENLADAGRLQTLFQTIDACPKLTVAAVHGSAFAGALGLIATCDFAIAAPEARFGLTEVRLGLIPAVISPYLLRKIGSGALRALATTATLFNPEHALRIGLIDCAALDYGKELPLLLESFLRLSPEAVAATKKLLRELDEGTADTVRAIAQARASSEGQEGIRAFLEKRKPSWVSNS